MDGNISGRLNLCDEALIALRSLIEGEPKQVLLLGHTNPDGDALGSALAWAGLLEEMGHRVCCIVPNRFPYFLEWMPRVKSVLNYKVDAEQADKAIAEADLIFCMDFHTLSRLEALSEAVAANTKAKRILIDHHLSPEPGYDLSFSFPESSSTAFIVYSIIEALYGAERITREMAELIYVGMMTDTGNFSFSNLTPALYRAVATLAGTGIDIPQLHNNVYNAYSPDRARLFGYVIHRKMKFLRRNTVAYMSLTEEEMRRYYFQQGDSEGFVNYPLTVGKMKMSAMFLAHHKFIRVSLRSRGEVDVNLFARRYFNGGGHHNAAGGKSYLTMEETIDHFCRSVEEFAREGLL